MFFSLFNFLSFGFLIPLLESLFNLWKRQKRNGWSVFYAIKRHTHTRGCMVKDLLVHLREKGERLKTPEYISCRSGCSQIQGKVHTIRRRKCGRSKADFATVRALNFCQSDRFLRPEDFKDSPVFFILHGAERLFRKKSNSQRSEGFEGLHTPTSWRHDNVNNLQQTPLC